MGYKNSNPSEYDKDDYGFLLTPIKVSALECTVWIETKGDVNTERVPVVRFRPVDKNIPIDSWPTFTLDASALKNCEHLSGKQIQEMEDWILLYSSLLHKHWEGLIDSAELVQAIKLMDIRIGNDGLTLCEVENHIIDIFTGRECADETFRDEILAAYKFARMQYLDSLNTMMGKNFFGEEDVVYKPEYEQLLERFRENDELVGNSFREEVKRQCQLPSDERSETIKASIHYRFDGDDSLDPHTLSLRSALLNGAKDFIVEDSFEPSYDRLIKKSGFWFYEISTRRAGYPRRMNLLKNSHFLADTDILSLKPAEVIILQ